jgi:hypothetical protein
MSSRWRWATILAGLALLWLFTPPDLPVCGFRWLTGRPCPFCGLTHAVFALAKGRVAEALRWRMTHLWMPCAAAFGIYGVWRIVF